MELQKLHERILYPVVRVRAEGAGGSGTIIYSQPDPEHEGEYLNFVMTCSHVIEGAVTTKKEWDSLLKKNIEKEFLKQVQVEIFDYVYLSKVNSSNSFRADIVAYDKYHDIAILKLESPKPCQYVANIISKDEIKNIKLFRECYASGCSLGHEPFANRGEITFLNEIIENKSYLMTNCSSIFGNSGGAIFVTDTGDQIGITARITAIQLGFGVDVMTWMGFAVHPERFYEFFDEQEMKFLYDSADTFKAAMDRREKKRKQGLFQIFKDLDEEPEEGKPSSSPFGWPVPPTPPK